MPELFKNNIMKYKIGDKVRLLIINRLLSLNICRIKPTMQYP